MIRERNWLNKRNKQSKRTENSGEHVLKHCKANLQEMKGYETQA
jgi:hypothetical protein